MNYRCLSNYVKKIKNLHIKTPTPAPRTIKLSLTRPAPVINIGEFGRSKMAKATPFVKNT